MRGEQGKFREHPRAFAGIRSNGKGSTQQAHPLAHADQATTSIPAESSPGVKALAMVQDLHLQGRFRGPHTYPRGSRARMAGDVGEGLLNLSLIHI